MPHFTKSHWTTCGKFDILWLRNSSFVWSIHFISECYGTKSQRDLNMLSAFAFTVNRLLMPQWTLCFRTVSNFRVWPSVPALESLTWHCTASAITHLASGTNKNLSHMLRYWLTLIPLRHTLTLALSNLIPKKKKQKCQKDLYQQM